MKPAVNSVGVHLQLSCKNPSNVGGSLTKHNTSVTLVGISKSIMPIDMGFFTCVMPIVDMGNMFFEMQCYGL